MPDYEGKKIPVWAFTNCDEVELFVNGKSYGKQILDKKENFHLEWESVVYEKGEVVAVGYRNGKKITSSIKTTGDVCDILTISDREKIEKDELAYVKVSFTDENGLFVPTANNKVTFTCDENISLVAIDNGSPDFIGFTTNEVPALSGYALAIVRGKNSGTANVTATSTNAKGEIISKTVSIIVK